MGIQTMVPWALLNSMMLIGVQTRLVSGPQMDRSSPLPQSLIAGGTGVGDTDKVVVRADALLSCMAADIQHLPCIGPQLRLPWRR